MSYQIKHLTPADASVFDHIADEVFDEPVNPERLAAYLADPRHQMFVAIADGHVVGQCAAVTYRHPDKPAEMFIDEVGVATGYRRRGIARALLDVMLALGKAMGCEEAWVGTEHDNKPARALYESYGSEAEPFVLYMLKL